MTKRKFLLQGIALTAFSLFFRITNIGYRAYLSGKIGAEGMGLYQLIFSVFLLAITLSTSGISLAVTRMVTAAIAANRRCTVRSVVTQCFLFCLTVSCTIAVLLLCFSDFAAAHILGNAGAAPSLRILALGLPFMSQCTCMKGYFLAVDESLSTSWSDAVEQVLTIFSAVVLFWYFAPQSIEAACFAAMIASTFGEAVSFLAGFLIYRRSLKRNTPKEKEQATGVLHGMFHIAVPCTLSSAARSLLSTAENLLIPRELGRYGLSRAASMSAYGLLQGMAMPMLYFPSSFLTSFASLLIPKTAREFELSHRRAVRHITQRAVHAALQFGIFCSGIFFVFGSDWGEAFYKSREAGAYLKILAPLVPLLYLDVVVDSLLKGLDEQLNSMEIQLFGFVSACAFDFAFHAVCRYAGVHCNFVFLVHLQRDAECTKIIKSRRCTYWAIEKCSDAGVFCTACRECNTVFIEKHFAFGYSPCFAANGGLCRALCRFAVPVFKAVHVSYGQKANR